MCALYRSSIYCIIYYLQDSWDNYCNINSCNFFFFLFSVGKAGVKIGSFCKLD